VKAISSRTLFLFASAVLLLGGGIAAAQTTPRITAPIDATQRVSVAHSVHPLATANHDLGAVDPGQSLERLILVLGTSADQELQLRTLLDSQQTAGSVDYHRWLTPGEFGRRFGPAPGDLQQVKNWLEQQGFRVGSVAGSGRWIEFSGTVQQVNDAFQTSLHRYQVAGATHIANATAVSVPAALAPVVRGVLTLHDFFSRPLLTHHYLIQRNAAGTFVPVNPDFTYNPGDFHYLTPADYANIYNFAPVYQQGITGSGQSIAIVARSKVELTDVETFRKIFNLPASDPQMIVNGNDPGFTGDDDSVEASLDAQWAGAIAPAAAIKLVVSASSPTTDGVDLSAAYIVDNNLAGIMSVSFGDCEQDLGATENAFWTGLWQQAAAQGISVFVSSGDTGAAGCDVIESSGPATGGLQVNGLASTPFNTAVGGTQFQENGNDSVFWNAQNGSGFKSAAGYIPEAVWNESCDPTVPNSSCSLDDLYELAAGSGGVSTIYSKPGWQTGSGVPNDGHRDVPDVSLAAAANHDGYLFCFEGSCQTTTDSQGAPLLLQADVVGGTSASSPSFAGLLALVNQKTGGQQGLANYLLYKLAAGENFSACDSSAQVSPAVRAPNCIFNDVTAGNNNVPGQIGYSATPGFDLASGLGSVNAANLVNAWNSAAANFQGSRTTLSAMANGAPVNSISFQHGNAVSLAALVQAISGSATPSGYVSFLTDRFGAVGDGALASGGFTGTFNTLPGGNYNLTAHYPGDGIFGGSDSNAIPVSITPENSVVTLSTSFGSATSVTAPYGASFSVQATVTSASGYGTATGAVTFYDGNSTLGTVPLDSSGAANLPACGTDFCLAIGPHSITASYAGDNSLNASAAATPLTLTLGKSGIPIMFLEISGPDSTGEWTLLAGLYPPSSSAVMPSGTLQFTDSSTPVGPVLTLASTSPNAAPTATTKVPLSPGTHYIGYSYSGDNVYDASTFPAFPLDVYAPFQLSAVNTLVAINPGQAATYNLNLSSNYGYTGNVSLTCSGAPSWAHCTISPSVVQLNQNASIPVAVTVTTTQSARLHSMPLESLGLVFAGVFAMGAAGGRKRGKVMACILALGLILGLSSCGGGGIPASTSTPSTISTPASAQSVAIVITGSDGTTTNNLVLGLQVAP